MAIQRDGSRRPRNRRVQAAQFSSGRSLYVKKRTFENGAKLFAYMPSSVVRSKIINELLNHYSSNPQFMTELESVGKRHQRAAARFRRIQGVTTWSFESVDAAYQRLASSGDNALAAAASALKELSEECGLRARWGPAALLACILKAANGDNDLAFPTFCYSEVALPPRAKIRIALEWDPIADTVRELCALVEAETRAQAEVYLKKHVSELEARDFIPIHVEWTYRRACLKETWSTIGAGVHASTVESAVRNLARRIELDLAEGRNGRPRKLRS